MSAATPPADPKTVRFQLITPDSPHTTARLPMRVQIYPHDATDSIVTTVKNFYGLYSSPTSSKGVSFEDEAGNTMIARYENFRNNMVVYVRVIEEPALSPSAFASRRYRSPVGDAAFANGHVGGRHPGPDGGSPPPYADQGVAAYPSLRAHPSGAAGPYDAHAAAQGTGAAAAGAAAAAATGPGPLPHLLHLHEQHGELLTRPGSRASRKRSRSPSSARGRRSLSASTHSKNRSRSAKNRAAGDAFGPDSMAGYSSGDGAPGSSSGRVKEQQPIGNTEISVENIVEGGRRKRAKFESSELPLFAPPQMPAATSNPSVSPARRSDHRPSLPYVYPGQNPFHASAAAAAGLHSPQHYHGQPHAGQGSSGVYATPGSDGRRTRASLGYSGSAGSGMYTNSGMGMGMGAHMNMGMGMGMGVLPTPDPTVSSVSEEDKDVAMQLMRLGEISNLSYGRTSTSTQDDTFSGRAEVASSTGATSDSESESASDEDEVGGDEDGDGEYNDADSSAVAPPARKQRLDMNGASRKIYPSVEPADDDDGLLYDAHRQPVRTAPASGGLMAAPKTKKVARANGANGAAKQPRAAPKSAKAKAAKAKAGGAGSMPFPSPASASNSAKGSKKASSSAGSAASHVPMSPASLPSLPRKLSTSASAGMGGGSGVNGYAASGGAAAAATALSGMTADGIADLSSKPRCQRCRKSKKGCDRQRPCGRCRDAGIPAELCISEDEGNGRKGRYGRHMGVPIKKGAAVSAPVAPSMQPPPPPPLPSASLLSSSSLVQATAHMPAPATMQPPPSPTTSYQPPAPVHAPVQQKQQSVQVPTAPPGLQGLPSSQQQPLPSKTAPGLLPPVHISSTPILAPTIPAMMMASAEKSKKRKR